MREQISNKETTAIRPLGEQLMELAYVEYQSRGGGREIYRKSSLLSLLIFVQSEIERVALLSAMSANIANALQAESANLNCRAIIRYFPNDTAAYTLSCMRLKKWYGDLSICNLLEDFNASQAAARQASIESIQKGFSVGRDSESESIRQLASAWQTACGMAHRVVLSIDHELSKNDIKGAAGEVSHLLQLLRQTAYGEIPLIAESGEPIMPSWGEQREYARILVRCPAILETGSVKKDVILRDMSIKGLGLQAVHALQIGAPVTVHVKTSMSFRGNVIWSQGDRAGVELRKPLHADDPGLSFLNSEVA